MTGPEKPCIHTVIKSRPFSKFLHLVGQQSHLRSKIGTGESCSRVYVLDIVGSCDGEIVDGYEKGVEVRIRNVEFDEEDGGEDADSEDGAVCEKGVGS